MTRDEITEYLNGISCPGPQPYGPEWSWEEGMEHLCRWAEGLTVAGFEILLELATLPRQWSMPDYPDPWEFNLTLVLGFWGRAHPEEFLEHAAPFLLHPQARVCVISAFGELGTSRGVSYLAPLVDQPGLSTDERLTLVDSLGQTGGPEAHALLRRMREQPGPDPEAIRKEIDLFLEPEP
jgi:hypothetical protein